MFVHKIDPLVQKELNLINEGMRAITQRCADLSEQITEVEVKLDHILSVQDPTRYIRTDDKKPEALAISPGYKSWSQRKRERIQKSADPGFAEKIVKSAAPTEPNVEDS